MAIGKIVELNLLQFVFVRIFDVVAFLRSNYWYSSAANMLPGIVVQLKEDACR